MPYLRYTQVLNPVYGDPNNKTIRCEVEFVHLKKVVPFIADADDVELHGQEIYLNCVAGKYGPIGPYVPKNITKKTNPLRNSVPLTSIDPELVAAVKEAVLEEMKK